MYARVTTFQVQPEKMDEGNQIARESVVPAIRQQAGFKGFYGLEDRTTGKSILITLFETEADMKAGVNSGFVQQQFAKIAPMVVGTPSVEFFEVVLQE